MDGAPLVHLPRLLAALPHQVRVAEDAHVDGDLVLRADRSKESYAGEENVPPAFHHDGVHSRPFLDIGWLGFVQKPADVV